MFQLWRRYLLHRIAPLRRILEKLEPFLSDFWHGDLDAQLNAHAGQRGKKLQCTAETLLFGGFYRVMECQVCQPECFIN